MKTTTPKVPQMRTADEVENETQTEPESHPSSSVTFISTSPLTKAANTRETDTPPGQRLAGKTQDICRVRFEALEQFVTAEQLTSHLSDLSRSTRLTLLKFALAVMVGVGSVVIGMFWYAFSSTSNDFREACHLRDGLVVDSGTIFPICYIEGEGISNK